MSALCIDAIPRTMLRSFQAEVKLKASHARETPRSKPERTVRRPCDSFSLRFSEFYTRVGVQVSPTTYES